MKTLIIILILFSATQVNAQTYLETSEILIIGSGSVSTVMIGSLIKTHTGHDNPLISGPLPLERSIQKFLGGSYYAGKSNFLDNHFGSAVTPVVGSLLLLSADLKYPSGDKTKTVLQDQFLYFSGLTATKGVTMIFKGLFDRERPLLELYPEEAAKREKVDLRYDHQSFFSGHTSSAFFSMAYANTRIRSIMRSEMSLDSYRKWRWVSPTILYGWAGFVGWSRIHSCKHYISDIFVGAAAGYLMSELFLSFGDDFNKSQSEDGQNYLLKFTLVF